MPDEETLTRYRAEGMANPPKLGPWADLVAHLRWSVELENQGAHNAELPNGMTSAEYSLWAIVEFLLAHDLLKHNDAIRPFNRLQTAILDLANGRTSDLFTPVKRPHHRPRGSTIDAFKMGVTARAMTELMDAGETKNDAARAVAKVINLQDVTESKIKNWRDRLMAGEGPGAPIDAVRHYQEALPLDMGDTAELRAKNLLLRLPDIWRG